MRVRHLAPRHTGSHAEAAAAARPRPNVRYGRELRKQGKKKKKTMAQVGLRGGHFFARARAAVRDVRGVMYVCMTHVVT